MQNTKKQKQNTLVTQMQIQVYNKINYVLINKKKIFCVQNTSFSLTWCLKYFLTTSSSRTEQNATMSLSDVITLWKTYAKFRGDTVERISVCSKKYQFFKSECSVLIYNIRIKIGKQMLRKDTSDLTKFKISIGSQYFKGKKSILKPFFQ